jgi:hypothetical protein
LRPSSSSLLRFARRTIGGVVMTSLQYVLSGYG